MFTDCITHLNKISQHITILPALRCNCRFLACFPAKAKELERCRPRSVLLRGSDVQHFRKSPLRTFSSSLTFYQKGRIMLGCLLSHNPECRGFVHFQQCVRCFHVDSRLSKATKIDGKVIAEEIKKEIKEEVDTLIEAGKRRPHLAVLLIGNDPASAIYVRNKAKAAEQTGISCDILRLPETVKEEDVLKEIEVLNTLPEVDGILVQLPLPQHMSERNICDAVLPQKDVDGFNVLNVGRFCVDKKAFIPATPSGVLEIIRRLKIDTCGKNAVVCGRSKNVGLPIALHLHGDRNGDTSAGDATTTICHRNTPPDQLRIFTQSADILVTATGVPNLITSDMVKDGVVIIDVGITRIMDEKGKARLVGDVDYKGVFEKASHITPVPGGVGPVTVAMVIKNTLIAYKKEIDY